MLRFHLDEHVPQAIAHGLRRRNIDVTTTSDAGLLNADDEEHLEFARRESRGIFTNDADFLRLAATGISHAGLAFCPALDTRIGEVVRYLALMDECYSQVDMDNHIEYL